MNIGDDSDYDYEADRRDAERYRWLRDVFFGADFDWGGSDEVNGEQVLLFKWPGGNVWGSLDKTVDEAMKANPRPPPNHGERDDERRDED